MLPDEVSNFPNTWLPSARAFPAPWAHNVHQHYKLYVSRTLTLQIKVPTLRKIITNITIYFLEMLGKYTTTLSQSKLTRYGLITTFQ